MMSLIVNELTGVHGVAPSIPTKGIISALVSLLPYPLIITCGVVVYPVPGLMTFIAEIAPVVKLISASAVAPLPPPPVIITNGGCS